MLYFFDTEFIEYPCTIDLISIGMVCEDGREFYAESSETDWSKASQWVRDNVRAQLSYVGESLPPNIVYTYDKGRGGYGTRSGIASELKRFVTGDDPEFWAYYSDYDWVVFCWLFGTMLDLPEHYPMFCRDIKQWAVDLGDPQLPKQEGGEHNALEDARWVRDTYTFLSNLQIGYDVR